MENNRTQECPNAESEDAVNVARTLSLVDGSADCNALSTTEQTINTQLYDALNGILDNLIGTESRWTISLHVPIRQYQHYRGWHSNSTSPTRRMRFHSSKHMRSALGKRNIRYLDYGEECSLMPKRKHLLEDKQEKSSNISERLPPVSETEASTSPRKSTPAPPIHDGSTSLFTSFETAIMPPITEQAHTDKCLTPLTAAERNFIEDVVERCFSAAMTDLQQSSSTVEYSITQRISDAQMNSYKEEPLYGEYSATEDVRLVTKPQLNDIYAISAEVGGEQQPSETCNSSGGVEINHFYERTERVSPKGMEMNLEFVDTAQRTETKSQLLGGFVNDAPIAIDPSISERVASAISTHARDILRPSLKIFETKITVSVDNAHQNVLLSPQKTDIDIAQLCRRPESANNGQNIEDESRSSSFKQGCSQETSIIASDVDASNDTKDSCKDKYEALEKRSVQRSDIDFSENCDGSDFSVTEEDTTPRRLSVLERVALKEQQMKLLKSPQTLILDGAKHRKRALSLTMGNSFNCKDAEDADLLNSTFSIEFYGISVRERVMLKEKELKEMEKLLSPKPSFKFLRRPHHAARRSISDPTERRRERYVVTAEQVPQTHGSYRESEQMSTPVLSTNNSKMKGTLCDENPTPLHSPTEMNDNDDNNFNNGVNIKGYVPAKEGELQLINEQTSTTNTNSKSTKQLDRPPVISSSKVKNPMKDDALDSKSVHEATQRKTNESNFADQHMLNAISQRDPSENIRHQRKQYSSTQAYTDYNCVENNKQEPLTERANIRQDENVDPKEGDMINDQCRVNEGILSRDFMRQHSQRIDWSYRFHKIRHIFENGNLERRKHLNDSRISDEKKKILDIGSDSESQKIYRKAVEDIVPSNSSDTLESEAIQSGKKHSQNGEVVEMTNMPTNLPTKDIDSRIPTPQAESELLLYKTQSPSTSDQELPSERHISGNGNDNDAQEHTDHAVRKETKLYRCSVKYLIQLKEDEIKRMDALSQKGRSPRRLKTISEEEYGAFLHHSHEIRKVRKENTKVSSPVVMIGRKDTPPATPTTRDRRSLLLGFTRPDKTTTSFNEEDEVEYTKKEEEKAAVQSALYSPGYIPQIAVQVVEQPLGRANIADHTDIAPKSSYDVAMSTDVSLISDAQQRSIVSTEQKTKSEASENDERMTNEPLKVVNVPIKWEQGFSSAVIRQMSRSNKWIPVEEEDEQVRVRREEFHARSHNSSLNDGKNREKPHVHKVSSSNSGGLDAKRKANIISNDVRSRPQVLINMRPVGAAYSRSLSLDGVSSLPEQTLISQSSRNKRPPNLNLNGHATSNSRPYSATVTPIWSPPHSYVPPTSPRRPMRDRNPPVSPRHHYVPVLHRNFSRPTSPSIVIRPSRSRTFELLSPFIERPARIDALDTKRHSLPVFTREASGEGRERSNKRASIGAASPISGVATLTSPSPLGERAHNFPRVNRHPYVPRIERLHREGDKQASSVASTFWPQNEDTLTASSFSLPIQQNVGYSRSLTESDLSARYLKNSRSLTEAVPESERFISGYSYANSELSKSTPNVAHIFSPPPFRSSFHQPIYSSLPPYSPKSVLSSSPFVETVISNAKSSAKDSQGDTLNTLTFTNRLSLSRTEKKDVNSSAEAADLLELSDRVESIQRPQDFSSSLTKEPVLSRTAEPQSSPANAKSYLTEGSLGDYYRIFQPAAYRSPDSDFIRSELKATQKQSTPVEHRSSKPVPVAVSSLASQKVLQRKVSSPSSPSAPLQPPPETPTSPLNRRLVYKEFAALKTAKITSSTNEQPHSDSAQQASTFSKSVTEKLLREEAITTPLSPRVEHSLLVGNSPVKSSASYETGVIEPVSPLFTQVNADSVRQSTATRSTTSGSVLNTQLEEKENVERFGPIKERFKNATLFFEEKAAEIQRANQSFKPKPSARKFTPLKSPTPAVRHFPTTRSLSLTNGSFAIMPAVNGSSPTQFADNLLLGKFDTEDSPGCAQWNPKLLIDKLYEIDYSPRKESKRNRFTNMEGHLDVPVDDKNMIVELQKSWTQKYFRTRDGRLQWFASHFADDCPVGEVLLSGCEVDANKEEGILSIYGGRDHVKVIVRVPLTSNLFDKWRKAITSHSASSYLDSFVHPVYPPLPHITEKVAIIELGSCSIRAGVLTMEPSLPQSFFPTIVLVKANGEIMVGADALSPENRHSGELVRPIHSSDATLERYSINKVALKACFQKCITDLRIDPRRYRVLLSIPQNIPTVLIADILKIILQELRFLGAAISRQPSLILYAYDVTTGVVVDIGDRLNIVPVIDGYVLDSAIVSLPYGALQITNALQAKLAETNKGLYTFRSPVERLILRYLMEQACYVSTSFEEDVQKCKDRFENVDMIVSLDEFQPTTEMLSTFKIDSARFTAPEGLFKPKRWGLDIKALHQLIHEAIQLAPIDSRKTLLRNIYLAGGASLLPGLAERLEVEISALVAPTIHTQVHLSPWRYNAAYLGAQIIASSTQFDTTCVTLDNLNEFINQLQCSTF